MRRSQIKQRVIADLLKLLHIQAQDLLPCCLGFGLLCSLFIGYFCMRPVRDTMGVIGGVDQLHWLFSATFIFSLLLSPVFAYLVSHVRRQSISRWLFGAVALMIYAFAAAMYRYAEHIWLARIFFVWLSVFNLIAISLAWSVLNDVFDATAGKRLFAMIASGASCGGLLGPLLGFVLVVQIGHVGLLIFAGSMVVLCIYFAERLIRHARLHRTDLGNRPFASQKLGGSNWQGMTALLQSRYLLAIGLFVLLLASVSTFLYIEQARYVAQHFEHSHAKTRFFAAMDMLVQTASLGIQFFLTGRIALKFGISALLCTIPLLMVIGLVLLSFYDALSLFVLVMCLRRVGEYALVRPGREMLFSTVQSMDKYKAKNFIDTVVYRAADAISSWLKACIDALLSSALAMLAAALLAAIWFAVGRRCAQHYQQRTEGKDSLED